MICDKHKTVPTFVYTYRHVRVIYYAVYLVTDL